MTTHLLSLGTVGSP